RLSIFDPNGRLLRQESFRGNEYQLQRQNLASGTYFYRLETAGQLIQSGKMIVH
ncbi:MAG: T9SS type A sorting domain-containing protein, partial [Saprospiraceae bacterium]|nr:T9SS type A sorting domain-containing protein [Saprospiraceae bacterium]